MTQEQGPGDPVLRAAVLELEQHAAEQGWDQPAQLFALVRTEELLAQEPGLAQVLGLDPETAAGTLTPVEQEPLPPDRTLEEVATEVVFGDDVHGVAAVVERLVLPPSAGEVPEDPEAARALAESHPDREEVRIVAAVTRDGATYCALRLRAHDDPRTVVEGPDLVPALLQLLHTTLDQ